MLGKIDCVRFVYDFLCATNILTCFIYINVDFNQYLNNGQMVYTATSLLILDEVYFIKSRHLNLTSKIQDLNEIYGNIFLYISEACSYTVRLIGIFPKTQRIEWDYLFYNILEDETKKVKLI